MQTASFSSDKLSAVKAALDSLLSEKGDISQFEKLCDELTPRYAALLFRGAKERLSVEISTTISPWFWSHISDFHDGDDNAKHVAFSYAIRELLWRIEPYFKIFRTIGGKAGYSDTAEEISIVPIIRSEIFSATPVWFPEMLQSLLNLYFKSFISSVWRDIQQDGTDGDSFRLEESQDVLISMLADGDVDSDGLIPKLKILGIAESMHKLGFSEYLSPFILEVAYVHMKNAISRVSSSYFDQSMYKPVKEYAKMVSSDWMIIFLSNKNSRSENEGSGMYDDIFRRNKYTCFQLLSEARSNDLFDIITEFPDSKPAIDDLARCLYYIGTLVPMLDALKGAITSRLLHAGASTSSILIHFANAIHVLTLLQKLLNSFNSDSFPQEGSFLLGTLSPLVMEYLRQRKDVSRAVASVITDELNQKGEESDIFQNGIPDFFMGVCGSVDKFAEEYKVTLASRLLNAEVQCDIDAEIQTIELLKLKFGDSPFKSCEIMLGDIANSERVKMAMFEDDNSLKEGVEEFSSAEINPTIISKLYWPKYVEEEVKEEYPFNKCIDFIQEKFKMLKSPRRIVWLHNMSRVTMTIAVAGTTSQVTSPLAYAQLLHLFVGRDEWSLNELSTKLEISSDLAAKGVHYWVSRGILSTSTDDIGSAVVHVRSEKPDSYKVYAENEDVGKIDENEQRRFKMIAEFVYGMLSNLDNMSAERIHALLELYVVDPPYDADINETVSLLREMVKEGDITEDRGTYALLKK